METFSLIFEKRDLAETPANSYEIIGFPLHPPKHTPPCEIIDTTLITFGILPGFPHREQAELDQIALKEKEPLSHPQMPQNVLGNIHSKSLCRKEECVGMNQNSALRASLVSAPK